MFRLVSDKVGQEKDVWIRDQVKMKNEGSGFLLVSTYI